MPIQISILPPDVSLNLSQPLVTPNAELALVSWGDVKDNTASRGALLTTLDDAQQAVQAAEAVVVSEAATLVTLTATLASETGTLGTLLTAKTNAIAAWVADGSQGSGALFDAKVAAISNWDAQVIVVAGAQSDVDDQQGLVDAADADVVSTTETATEATDAVQANTSAINDALDTVVAQAAKAFDVVYMDNSESWGENRIRAAINAALQIALLPSRV